VSRKHAFQVALGMEGAICLVQLVKRALPLSPLPNFACSQSRRHTGWAVLLPMLIFSPLP
jgi:hypothetical protein